MKVRKNIVCSILLCLSLKGYSLNLEDLTKMILETNREIKTSTAAYEAEVLSTKYLNGAYTPRLALNSSATLPKEYEFDNIPDYFSSSLSYSQPLPGGASVSLDASYSFNYMNMEEIQFLTQKPVIALTLSQSLMPFWVQGQIKDPVKLSAKQKKEYYYYQLNYTKKNIWLSLLQYYVNTFICLNEISTYKNNIELYNYQIDSVKELKQQGKTSQAAILEIENSKWSAQQSFMTAQANYLTNIQNLKSLCGQNFDEKLLEIITEKNIEKLLVEVLGIDDNDPLEQTYRLKLEMLESGRIAQKQATAPVMNLSVQPGLALNTTKKDEWKNAWKDMDSPSSWTVGIGFDFSSVFSGVASQNTKKYKIEYNEALESYTLYLRQRDFVLQQYNTLVSQYCQQKEIIDGLYNAGLQELNDYKQQYEADAISKLDFEAVKVRVENCKLMKENIELNLLLYNIMAKLYDYS